MVVWNLLIAIFIFAVYFTVNYVLRYVFFKFFEMMATRKIELFIFYLSLVSGFVLGPRVEEFAYSIFLEL